MKGFRTDIQGLRGLAVLVVVLFHAGLLPAGFVGVDVFFVISGFVVSRSLLRGLEREGGAVRPTLTAFYLRRFARLFPAFSVAVLALTAAATVLGPLVGLERSLGTARAGMLLASNVYLYKHSPGYFTLGADDNAFLHLWSLSVEEQFYLSFPLLLLLAGWISHRRGGSGAPPMLALVFVGVATFLSFLLGVAFADGGFTAWGAVYAPADMAFFSPLTRAWEFGAGAWLAVRGPERECPSRPTLLAGVGLGLLAAGLVLIDGETPFPGWMALLPVGGTTLLLLAGSAPRAWIGRGALELKPLVWMGDVSYSWYLWHWPFMVFARSWLPSSPLVLLAAGTAALLPAWASYELLENRLRIHPTDSARGRARKGRIGLGIGVCALVGVAFLATRVPVSSPALEEWKAQARFHLDFREGCDRTAYLAPDAPGPACRYGVPQEESRGSVILIGDSNAGQFSEGLVVAATELGMSAELHTHSSCPPALGVSFDGIANDPEGCARYSGEILDLLEEHPPSVVVFTYSQSYLLKGRQPGARPAPVWEDDGSAAEALMAGTRDLLMAISRMGHSLVLLEEIPKFFTRPVGGCSALQARLDFRRYCTYSAPIEAAADRLENSRRFWGSLAEQLPGAVVVGFREELCPEGVCRSHRNGRAFYRDPVHLSVDGSVFLGDALRRAIGAVLPRGGGLTDERQRNDTSNPDQGGV